MLLLICVTKLIFLAYLFDFEVSLYSIHALALVMRFKYLLNWALIGINSTCTTSASEQGF